MNSRYKGMLAAMYYLHSLDKGNLKVIDEPAYLEYKYEDGFCVTYVRFKRLNVDNSCNYCGHVYYDEEKDPRVKNKIVGTNELLK